MGELPFQRIAIIGLGLVGGSWGLALKRSGWVGVRIGCDRPEVSKLALAAGAIDGFEEDPLAAARDASLVVLAAPVSAILDLLPRLRGVLSPGVLVTDVGSTKAEICERAGAFASEGVLFLGGHPLAGKERPGIEHADAALFEGAWYALVARQSEDWQDSRVNEFVSLISGFGARPFRIGAAAHDRTVAYLSHLPQLISTGLASLLADESAFADLPLELAARGFRDVTRLAESPYLLWRDICRTNHENIRIALDAFIRKLEGIKRRLTDDSLGHDFRQAAELRARLRGKA
jgi:prephenate dehydrogenase